MLRPSLAAASLIFLALCRYDHTNDLGLGGGPKPGAIGSREEDYVSLYAFLDKNFPGRYIKEWEPFDHPQLGAVEIGGLDSKWCLQNPPPELLEQECERNTSFALALLAVLPVVKVSAATAEPLGGGATKVTVAFRNEGFLPTNCTAQAISTKAVRAKAAVAISLAPTQEFVMGSAQTEVRAALSVCPPPVASDLQASLPAADRASSGPLRRVLANGAGQVQRQRDQPARGPRRGHRARQRHGQGGGGLGARRADGGGGDGRCRRARLLALIGAEQEGRRLDGLIA